MTTSFRLGDPYCAASGDDEISNIRPIEILARRKLAEHQVLRCNEPGMIWQILRRVKPHRSL